MASILIIWGGLATTFGLGDILFGFGTVGVVAGSAAAATQSSIENVAAGSLFATMTSLWMTGALIGTAIGGGVTTTIGALTALL